MHPHESRSSSRTGDMATTRPPLPEVGAGLGELAGSWAEWGRWSLQSTRSGVSTTGAQEEATLPERGPSGAGDGNRTRTTSLEGWGSAVELRPRERSRAAAPDSHASHRRSIHAERE